MNNYKCIIKQGYWYFQAADHLDAVRLALFYCWRDNEDFVGITPSGLGGNYTIKVIVVDKNGSVQTL